MKKRFESTNVNEPTPKFLAGLNEVQVQNLRGKVIRNHNIDPFPKS